MKKTVAIIDYGMGNLHSVLRAWQAAGADARLVSAPREINVKDIVVFPGQGAIVDTMKLLRSTGFDVFIREWIAADRPFFGICLGLQALFERSEEGDGECLNVFKGRVERLNVEKGFKVPHMGWNNVSFKNADDAMLGGINANDQFYFVHSYCVKSDDKDLVFGATEYGGDTFVSCIKRGNLFACQFHPEKSQAKGLLLYMNFLKNH